MTDKREYIQDAIDKLFALWLRRGSVSGAFIFLLLSFLDFTVFPEHFKLFLGYRIAIALFLLLFFGLARKTTNRTALRYYGLAAVTASAVTIEAMILHTGGDHSLYAMGMILLTVSILAFVPAELPFHAALAGVIYGIYLLPIIMTMGIDELPVFFVTNFFMCSIILIVLVFRYQSMQTLKQQLATEYELTLYSTHLQESEQKQRLLLQSANDAIYVQNLSPNAPGRFLEVNDRACLMLGYTREELLSMEVRQIDVPEQKKRISGIIRQLTETGSAMFETEHVAKDGGRVPVEVSTRLLHLHGQPTVMSVVRDITERKKFEDELKNYQTHLEQMVEKRTVDLENAVAQLEQEVKARRGAESAVGRSRRLLDGVFESIQDGIVVLDTELNIITSNSAFRRHFGADASGGGKARKCFEVYHSAEERCKTCTAFKAMSERTIQAETLSYQREGCDPITLEIFTFPFYGEQGELRGVVQHLRDITERKKSEIELQRKEARMRAMLESFDGLIYICSPDYRVEFMNENLIRRTGRNAVGEYCYAVMNNRDTICPWCANNRVFRGEIVRYEIQSPIDDRWYHVVNTPIRHDKDSISKLAMFLDVTETKKADIALKESEKRYRRLVASVTDYIYTVTVQEGRPGTTEHGEGCFAVTGYTAAQYEADPDLWYRMVYDSDRDSVAEQAKKIIAGERAIPLEHRIIHRNGSIRWVQHIIAPLFDNSRKLLSFDGLISDITEKKLLEEQLEKAMMQEEENLKVFSRLLLDVQEEERRSIARELHDEIGQSLTGLKLSVENIADSLPSQQADDMRPIEVSLGELISLVRSISLDLRPAMLDDFGLVNTLRWHFERYTLQTGISVDFIGTMADRRFGPQIEIALYRITQESLTNVARYAAVKNVLVELNTEQDRVTLRIRDNGQGFDMTSPALSVSSGLSIMRERSILLKGTFSLSSEPGKGTEITASLPLNDAGDGQGGLK